MKTTGDKHPASASTSPSPKKPRTPDGSLSSSRSGALRAADEQRIRQLLDETLLILDRESSLSEMLLKQAQEMQRHLLADDYMALLAAAQEQETCSQELAQWEHRRFLLRRHLAAFSPALAHLRLSQWVNYLPEPYASRLHGVQVALRRATTQLQTVNRQNMALVQRSLRFAEMALGVESPTYRAPRGQKGRNVDSPHLLDKTL